ncbi:MAG TPA: hypothetical protein VHC48_05270 [Puia sp.]|nr:hypothetical protein [Puia sp.]
MGKLSLPTGKIYLLWACILLCLLPFVILSFFSVMAADDFTLWGIIHDHGFFEGQKWIYFYWEGRPVVSFVAGLFEVTGIVRHYYFLIILLYSFFTWMALLLLLSCINSRCLGRTFSFTSLLPASLILYILNLYVMAEIATGVYWFSSVAVYQTAFILFLVLAVSMVRRFTGGAERFRGWDLVIILLAILICGCNEIAAIALACCFLLLIGLYIYYRRPIPRVLFLYLGVVLLTGITILLTSGVLSGRTLTMKGRTGNAGVILILFGRGLSVFYYVLKEPLLWMCGSCSFVLGLRMSAVLEPFLHVVRTRRFFIPGLLGILLVVFGTLAPVLMVTHGSIPERAINNLTSLSALYLLGLAFLSGACRPGLYAAWRHVPGVSTVLVGLLSCTLLASYTYKEAWKNVVTGYFYHAIQVDRQKVLLTARERHQRSATIIPYAAALEEKARQFFPHGIPVTVRELLNDQPAFLYHVNVWELPGNYLYRYYQLDSVVVKQF